MTAMTPDECRRFLMGAERPAGRSPQARTAKLATVRPDGRPHVVPVWFDLQGETLVFTMANQTVKAANIRRDPRVCLCVDDERPPFGYVQIEGTAHIAEDRAALRHWATRIAGRYMGADRAEIYGERYSGEGEILVQVSITRWIGQKDVVV